MLLQSNHLLIKRFAFTLCLWPIFSICFHILNNNLGANPVEFIVRHFGKWSLIFLCLTLSMSPLRRFTKITQWILYRRMLGLFVFFYTTVHLFCYIGIDYHFDWVEIKNDIVEHRFVLVGFLGWVLLIPLALTSSEKMIRRLKANWKKLHRLIYVIAILGALHFIWLVKKDITEPFIYILIILILLLCRIRISKTNLKNKKLV